MNNKILKTIAASLLALEMCMTAFGQGVVNFFTFNTNPAKGQVFFGGSTIPLSDYSFYGQLWFSDISATTGFYAASPALIFTGGYINDGTLVVDPNRSGGSTFWYQLRVWDAAAGADWMAATGFFGT